ncbi:unnamed protein product [Meloidogyne enterolobii]
MSSTPLTAVPAAPASRVAPDSPNDENVDRDAVARIVKGVGEGWCCHLANNSIALFIPSKLFDITLSREHFVNLLEYCEEHLKVKRVLACFDKSEIDPREGIPRALKCIGFSVLPPNRFPNWLDPKTTFAMVYTI